jgi:hypothetical protein
MHNFYHLVAIGLEVCDRALSFGELYNSGTWNVFGTTISETRHISVAWTRSYKLTLLIAITLASYTTIFSWSISLEYCLVGIIDKSIHNCWGQYRYCWLHKSCITLLLIVVELLPDSNQKSHTNWTGLHQRCFWVFTQAS